MSTEGSILDYKVNLRSLKNKLLSFEISVLLLSISIKFSVR